MSINRSGETIVELATQSRKSFFYVDLNVLGNLIFLLEDFRYWYKYTHGNKLGNTFNNVTTNLGLYISFFVKSTKTVLTLYQNL